VNFTSFVRLVALFAIVMVACIALWLLPINTWQERLVQSVSRLGAWGPVILALAYIPAAVLFLPAWPLTVGAGYAFGVLVGTIAVSIGSTAGATAAFVIGRTIARHWVEQRIAQSPKFHAIDRAVAKASFKIVLLTRLSPVIPFNALNYALALTNVSLVRFVLASWIGMLPATVVYVYAGSTARTLAEATATRAEGQLARGLLLTLGLIATLAVTWYITGVARRALAEEVAAEPLSRRPE